MKKLIITLVLLGLLSIPNSMEAQRHGSELQLRIFDNSYFTVVFDRKIYDSPTSFFRLSNVSAGKHRLIIKQKFGGRYGSFRTIFNGSIDIPARSTVNARINRYNRLVIGSVVPNRGNYYSERNYNRNYNKQLLDMHRLEIRLRNAHFENDRRMIAERAISSHKVKSHQVYRIITMLSFESTKVKVAKFAYRHCIDKRNYYLVNDAFAFSSSIRELDNFIENYRSEYYDDDWSSERGNYYNNSYKVNSGHKKAKYKNW